MKKSHLACVAGLLPLVMALGCNTPQSRIDDNPELFATYPSDVQASIKSGQIQQGFDQNQVHMALGKPSKKSAQGGTESWTYLKVVKKNVTQKKDVYKYELERRQYEEKKASGQYALEPQLEETIQFKRTKVSRTVQFAAGKVSGWNDPQDEYLDDWHS